MTVRKRTWTSPNGEVKSAWVADYQDVRGKRRNKTFARKKDADAYELKAKGEVLRGVHTPESASITVAEAAVLWLKRGHIEGLERSTLEGYRNHVDTHINPLIGTVKLARLTTPMVGEFRDELLLTRSRVMVRDALSSLKGILKHAQQRGLAAQNVATPISVDVRRHELRRLEVGRDIPTKEEVNTLIANAGGRLRPLLITAVYTGMRISEIRGLAWDAIDFEAKVIDVRQRADIFNALGPPKTKAGRRSVPMAPMVVNALREWKLACPKWPSGLVFPNNIGTPKRLTHIIDRELNPLQIACGVVDTDGRPKYSMHKLRHFFASMMIERGVPAKWLQTLIGHSNITMTYDTYGHLFPSAEDDQARFAAFELALTGRRPP